MSNEKLVIAVGLLFIFLLITRYSLLITFSACVLDRFPALFEHFAIPDKARARIGG